MSKMILVVRLIYKNYGRRKAGKAMYKFGTMASYNMYMDRYRIKKIRWQEQ